MIDAPFVLWYNRGGQGSSLTEIKIEKEINMVQRNYNLQGKTVAVRKIVKTKDEITWWWGVGWERTYSIEKVLHVGNTSFLTENDEYNFADIIRVF